MTDTNTEAKPIEAGDVVRLKSGSADMTVATITGDQTTGLANLYWWHSGHQEISAINIPLAALMHKPDDK